MRQGERKLLGLLLMLILFSSWTFGLMFAPIGVNSNTFESDIVSPIDRDLESQANVDELSSIIDNDLQYVDNNLLIYKYKPEELTRATNTYNFLINKSEQISPPVTTLLSSV